MEVGMQEILLISLIGSFILGHVVAFIILLIYICKVLFKNSNGKDVL